MQKTDHEQQLHEQCLLFKTDVTTTIPSRDGTVVRVLASHQCGPGWIPGPSVICGLNLSFVLVPARGYMNFSWFSRFPDPSTKPILLNSNSIGNIG